tara:strand:- start:114 stop:812 length:699 start_codon:yes stop_codon:yes gene_type:complete
VNKNQRKIKLKFEDYIDQIDEEIRKRKSKWTLTSIAWMDFDDISQILRIHIYKKWSLFDQDKPLGPWLNRIISNQIKNIIRNNYGNYARPCLKCAAAEPDDGCAIYGEQCDVCPLFKTWLKRKKSAYDLKITVPLDNHIQEIQNISSLNTFDEFNLEKIHRRMKQLLKPVEWKVYFHFYIKNVKEREIAKMLGFKTTEKNRSPGYKQLRNIQKSIINKFKKCLRDDELDLIL